MQSRVRHLVDRFLPGITVVALIVIWQVCCMALGISEHLLPAPSLIARAFAKSFTATLVPDALTSLRNMCIGYLIAVPLGFVIAALASQFKLFVRMCLPVFIVLMVTPMATLVPEFKLFLGVSQDLKIIIIVLQCMPVIAVNTITGFSSTPANKLDVARGLGMRRWETFARIVVPNALPQVFTGLKLGAILCTIATMSADLSVGQGGIGYRISISASTSATDVAFAAIIVAAAIGVTFYSVITLIESRVVSWN